MQIHEQQLVTTDDSKTESCMRQPVFLRSTDYRQSIGNRQQVHSAVQCEALCLCRLEKCHKMQLTGCHNGNEKPNATYAASKTSKIPTLFISFSMLSSRLLKFRRVSSDADTTADAEPDKFF